MTLKLHVEREYAAGTQKLTINLDWEKGEYLSAAHNLIRGALINEPALLRTCAIYYTDECRKEWMATATRWKDLERYLAHGLKVSNGEATLVIEAK